MNKKKKKISLRLLAAVLILVGIIGFLVNKDQIKITVVNSFSDAYADSENYHKLTDLNREITSFKELITDNKKTFIFTTSSWCSLCSALSVKFIENTNVTSDYVVYEADIEQFRPQLAEFKVSTAPKLILISKDSYRVLDDVRFDNLEQILSTEL